MRHALRLADLACCLVILGAWAAAATPTEDEKVRWLRGRARRAQGTDEVTCAVKYTGSWALLSSERQQAWSTLGWTQGLWDVVYFCGLDVEGSPTCEADPTLPASETKCYADLTEEERVALKVLGYSIQDWHTCKDSSCPWPDGIPLPSAPCLEHLSYIESRYSVGTRSWSSIPAPERQQLEALMWSQSRWNAHRKPDVYATSWSQLAPAERSAAMFLGYDLELWDGCPSSPCFDRLRRVEEMMLDWVWRTMYVGLREHLEALGWTELRWSRGEHPPDVDKLWVQIPDLRRHARLLGYQEDSWDGCPDSPCISRYQYVTLRWQDRSWMDMKQAEQQAWMLLGQSQQLWTDFGIQQTPTLLYMLHELTPEQQEAAMFLGHSAASWRGCSNSSMVQVVDPDEDGGGTVDAGSGDDAVEVGYLVGGSFQTLCVRAVSPDVGDLNGCAMDTRTVRARMTIERPFSEISGNIYGQQVADLPTSFVQVFETSVARALFCDNPHLSVNPSDMVDANGQPRCDNVAEYNRQRPRVRVVRVLEGSIIVDFFIIQNLTAADDTALYLFLALQRQLEQPMSPISLDAHFSSFAAAASMVEIAISEVSSAELVNALDFEKVRNKYTEDNVCELTVNWAEDMRCWLNAAPWASSLQTTLVTTALLHGLFIGVWWEQW